ncbi:hypothetical protein DFH06DRAFT_1129735 [Mycena polygramma]|nr:hypothetical protein DFH06DRAFT_1129735 [Mycena polygramma]
MYIGSSDFRKAGEENVPSFWQMSEVAAQNAETVYSCGPLPMFCANYLFNLTRNIDNLGLQRILFVKSQSQYAELGLNNCRTRVKQLKTHCTVVPEHQVEARVRFNYWYWHWPFTYNSARINTKNHIGDPDIRDSGALVTLHSVYLRRFAWRLGAPGSARCSSASRGTSGSMYCGMRADPLNRSDPSEPPLPLPVSRARRELAIGGSGIQQNAEDAPAKALTFRDNEADAKDSVVVDGFSDIASRGGTGFATYTVVISGWKKKQEVKAWFAVAVSAQYPG